MTDQKNGFECINCGKRVPINDFIGTKNRNHCPSCLWSKHVDGDSAGDRTADCHGKMQPVGLTFKDAGIDKYGKPRQGELMIIHSCTTCGKISINRIAGDDESEKIVKLLTPADIPTDKLTNIKVLGKNDESQVKVLLFGKS